MANVFDVSSKVLLHFPERLHTHQQHCSSRYDLAYKKHIVSNEPHLEAVEEKNLQHPATHTVKRE